MKESTSSVQVEALMSHQGEKQVDLEASTSGTRQDEGNEEVQQEDPPQPPSPPPQVKNDAINNEEEDEDEDVRPQPKKSSHELERELLKTIPSSKSTMISKPGESLSQNSFT